MMISMASRLSACRPSAPRPSNAPLPTNLTEASLATALTVADHEALLAELPHGSVQPYSDSHGWTHFSIWTAVFDEFPTEAWIEPNAQFFWINRTGGFSGFTYWYGPGVVAKDGTVRAAPPH